jgi:lysophospholipase L1-like esterase
MRRLRLLAFVPAVLALALVPTSAQAGTVPLPNSMAATGDSITRAYNSTWFGCLLTDCPQYSWSTGTSATVNSHYLRILALHPAIEGHNYNDARTGAKMRDLQGQLALAAQQRVQYVTVFMGANDVCTSSVDAMTSTADFSSQFASAMTSFFAANPRARVYVSSVPRVTRLYELFKDNLYALLVWQIFNICQTALPPGGTDASRQQVDEREAAYNASLQQVCGRWPTKCRYDGGAGFGFAFPANDVSTVDYFHPSITGQMDIAALTWAHSYWAG